MNVLAVIPTEVAWPLALLVAWVAGEVGHRLTRLPRISLYSLTGFALGSSQLGLLPDGNAAILLLANMAFGLILFELGYRINLRWLRANPWIGVSSLAEALLTFGGVFATARWFGTSTATALVVATLAMSTSPAGILRVVNEQRSAGQVTERVLLFSALSCALAVFAFKVIVGVVTAPAPGASWHAVQVSALVLVASAVVGSALGVLMPALLRALRRTTQDGTVAFAVAVVFLVALTHTVRL